MFKDVATGFCILMVPITFIVIVLGILFKFPFLAPWCFGLGVGFCFFTVCGMLGHAHRNLKK